MKRISLGTLARQGKKVKREKGRGNKLKRKRSERSERRQSWALKWVKLGALQVITQQPLLIPPKKHTQKSYHSQL